MIDLKRGFIRYKGLQVLLWLILSVLILLIYCNPKAPVTSQSLAALLITGHCSIPAYYGAYRLVPQLLYKKKTGAFIAWLVLAAAVHSQFT